MKWILETQRLKLREFVPDDDVHFFNLNSDPQVILYTGDKAFETVADARTFLENYSSYQEQGYGRWAMISKVDGDFIGWCGLKMYEGQVDLGYRLFRKYWNHGYASEAAKACLDYGFNELTMDRIIARAARANIASIRVLEKIGMQFEKFSVCDHIEDAVQYVINK